MPSNPTLTFVTLNTAVENAPAVRPFADVTFTDDENDFDGSSLTISGLSFSNILSVADFSSVTVSGATIAVGGTDMATMSGGNGADFVLNFTGATTAAGIEAIIEAITLEVLNDSPSAEMSLVFSMQDQAGNELEITDATYMYSYKYEATPYGLGVGFADSKYVSPTFFDIDGDGDKDAFLGREDGSFAFYRNNEIGTGAGDVNDIKNLGLFTYEGGATPFGLQDLGDRSNISFVDIDHDGDMDAFVGGCKRYCLFL